MNPLKKAKSLIFGPKTACLRKDISVLNYGTKDYKFSPEFAEILKDPEKYYKNLLKKSGNKSLEDLDIDKFIPYNHSLTDKERSNAKNTYHKHLDEIHFNKGLIEAEILKITKEIDQIEEQRQSTINEIEKYKMLKEELKEESNR